MSNILEQLQARRRHEVVLQSGLKIGYHYPDIQECILAGGLPMPALAVDPSEITEEAAAKTLAENPDAARMGWEFKRRLVSSMLDDIDGEDISPDDDREAIVSALDPQERDELFRIATERGKPGEA